MGRRHKPRKSLIESREALAQADRRDREIHQVTASLDRHLRINDLGNGFAHVLQERRRK